MTDVIQRLGSDLVAAGERLAGRSAQPRPRPRLLGRRRLIVALAVLSITGGAAAAATEVFTGADVGDGQATSGEKYRVRVDKTNPGEYCMVLTSAEAGMQPRRGFCGKISADDPIVAWAIVGSDTVLYGVVPDGVAKIRATVRNGTERSTESRHERGVPGK